MLLDKNLELDPKGSAITVTRASTNVVDLGTARDIAPGLRPVAVVCQVDTAFTTTDAATLTVAVQGSTDNSTWDTYMSSPAYAAAALVAGARLFNADVPMVPAGKSLPRYLRLNYTVGTGSFTAGKVGAWFNLGRDDQVVYPKNYTA